MTNQYSYKVQEHFAHPHNAGELPNPDARGEAGNPVCGDIMQIDLKIDGDIITDIKFKTFGCAAAVATTSMLTEMAKGKTITEARAIQFLDVQKELDGLPPLKVHCAKLAVDALHNALDAYENKN